MSIVENAQIAVENLASHNADDWDAFYGTGRLTDWEMLSPNELRDTLIALTQSDAEIETAIEVGCGRGLRMLAAILGTPGLNRPSFQLCGVDHSDRAIRMAAEFAATLANGKMLASPFREVIAKAATPGTPLRAQLRFEKDDLFKWLMRRRHYAVDLVIDWMCLHEIISEERRIYADLIAASCRKHFVLNTFSIEGSSLRDLGFVGSHIRKFQLSQLEVEALFGTHFRIVSARLIPEDLNPEPRPSDGVVAAKCVYVMERRTV